MPNPSNMQIPPPSNWQDFESLCCDLWRRIWKDENTKKNGRQGQPQAGVDVYGRPNKGNEWAGVQCKGKDNFTDKKLTKKEVTTEVEKAKSFKPKLSEFIIATTGPKDAKIDELCREITNKHLQEKLFSVTVMAWNDIKDQLEDEIDKYCRIETKTKIITDKIDESNERMLASQEEIKNRLDELLKSQAKPNKEAEKAFKKIIEECKILARNGKPNKALDNLNQLKKLLHLFDQQIDLKLHLFIAQAKALREAEKIQEAINKNQEIISDYPEDIRPHLYLADIYLSNGDDVNYQKYLDIAEAIDPSHPTIKSLKLSKRIRVNEEIEIADNEVWGEEGSWERAFCYFQYSIINFRKQNLQKRDGFIQKAIGTWPENISFRTQKIGYETYDLSCKIKEGKRIYNLPEKINDLLQNIEKLEYLCVDDDTPKRKLRVEICRFEILFIEPDNIKEKQLRQNFESLIELILENYYDDYIDGIIATVIDRSFPLLSEAVIKKLVNYIGKFDKKPSNELTFLLVIHALSFYENLEEIKDLCRKFNRTDLLSLVEAIEVNDEEQVAGLLNKNFNEDEIIKIILCLKATDLRLKIINKLPQDRKGDLNKIKLMTLYSINDFNSAIELIKKIDIKNAELWICRIVSDIAHEIGFYETEKESLLRIIESDAFREDQILFKAKLAIAQFYLKEYKDAIKSALEGLVKKEELDDKIVQSMFYISLYVLNHKGKKNEALKLLNKYSDIPKNFQINFVCSEIYLKNGSPKKAKQAIIDAFLSLDDVKDEYFFSAHYQFIMIENISGCKIKNAQEIKDDTFVKIDGIDDWFYLGNKKSLGAIKIKDLNDERYKALINKKISEEIEWPGDYGRLERIKRKIKKIVKIDGYIGCKGAEVMMKHAQLGYPYVKLVEVGRDINTMKKSLLSFMNKESKENELYELYGQGKLPLCFLITSLGSVGATFYKFRFDQKYFININNNDKDLEDQKKVALKAISGDSVHIDGTSLFMLLETGFYEKTLIYLPNFYVPTSVLEEYRNLINKFSLIPKEGLMQLGQAKGDIAGTIYTKDYAEKIRDKIITFCDFIQNNAIDIYGIPKKEKLDDIIEQNILPSVSDACIMAQRKESDIVMTEDPSYIFYNNLQTKKRKPEHFSVWAFARVLYEEGKISWYDYS